MRPAGAQRPGRPDCPAPAAADHTAMPARREAVAHAPPPADGGAGVPYTLSSTRAMPWPTPMHMVVSA